MSLSDKSIYKHNIVSIVNFPVKNMNKTYQLKDNSINAFIDHIKWVNKINRIKASEIQMSF